MQPDELPILALVQSDALHDLLADGAQGFVVHFRSVRFPAPDEAVTLIADLHPALIVVEMDEPVAWLPVVRSDPATRRVPVIGVGSSPEAARRAAEAYVPLFSPGDFRARLPGVLRAHARVFDQADLLRAQCERPPPALVIRGLREFNAGEYYACHESFEEAWMAERGPLRNLYRVILQVGVAYYQITRGNYQGARKMLLRAAQWFANLPEQCQGIDVAQLRADAGAVRAHLEALGPERIAAFDRSLLRPVIHEHGDA